MSLSFRELHVRLGRTPILRGASVLAAQGAVTGIVGPNGSGKSTLIKTLFSLVAYQGGTVLLDGENIHRFSRREIARRVGYVAQETHCAFDFSVREIVSMGRFPHPGGGGARRTAEIVEEALAALGLLEMADRNILTLSGGEKKMVFLARAVAQDVGTIVLDEPTNHLDIKHQLFILDYLRNSGKTVLLVLHDLALAARYCDTVFLLNGGQTVASGAPLAVLTPENIRSVFGVEGYAFRNESGNPSFTLQ